LVLIINVNHTATRQRTLQVSHHGHHIQTIKKAQPQGPYRLAGWSMGALITYEIVKQLQEQDEQIAYAGLLDGYPAQDLETNEVTLLLKLLTEQNLIQPDQEQPWQTHLEALPEEQRLDKVLEHLKTKGMNLEGEQQFQTLWQIFKTMINLAANYQPQPTKGPFTLLRSTQNKERPISQAWEPLTEVKTIEVEGTHNDILSQKL
jgi:thioesterase domain-containing protein